MKKNKKKQLTPEQIKIIEFYNLIETEDIALIQPPKKEWLTKGHSGTRRLSGKRTPLPYRIVETHIDLGIAIDRGDWKKAKRAYRYLRRMMGFK